MNCLKYKKSNNITEYQNGKSHSKNISLTAQCHKGEPMPIRLTRINLKFQLIGKAEFKFFDKNADNEEFKVDINIIYEIILSYCKL